MTTPFSIWMRMAALVSLTWGGIGCATTTAHDPTKYDCREVVGWKIVNRGAKTPDREPILACPHKDKLAAGQCETHWFFGMRCKP